MSNRHLEAFATTLLLTLTPFAAPAQERAQEKETKTVEKEKPAEPTPPPPKEESSVTEHSIKIAGQTISYKAIAGTILLKNEKDEPQAIIYSTSYIRSDVKDLSQRPISFIYNGGPGSPSLWAPIGPFRSAARGHSLQEHDGLDFNGIVLISSVLDLGTISFHPGEDLPYIFYLPSYAATASYHKVLKEQPADLNAFLDEARKFAQTDYAGALMKGSRLTATEKADMAKKVSRYTGLSEDYLIKANFPVTLGHFMEELQRSRGLTTGRLDSRYSGLTYDLLGEFAESDPQSSAVTGAFTAAFNSYVRNELNFDQDKTYHAINEGVGSNWDWKHQTGRGRGYFPSSPNVEGDLAQALLSNPHLQVEVENGFFDMATPFFATEYTMDHLGLPEQLQKNIRLQYYDAGHMMYLRDEDLSTLKANIGPILESASKHSTVMFSQ